MISQHDVLLAYLALCEQRETWDRKLVLLTELTSVNAPYAMAGVIAGAAVLSLTQDATFAREAMRLGGCDYVVTSLDESLRILKNNLRTGKPAGVALVADVAEARRELDERGVMPDFVIENTLTPGRSATQIIARDYADRRRLDEQASAGADHITERWLRAAPMFFPRDLTRWLPVPLSHP